MDEHGVSAVRQVGRPVAQMSLLEPNDGRVVSKWAALPIYDPDGARLCVWCGERVSSRSRRDTLTCSKRCRQARHRFGAGLRRLERTKQPLRLAYADPPYPGLAGYYEGHPDFAGEVDHQELLERLAGYDGWALSTNARSLPTILQLCGELGLVAENGHDVRVAAWVRGARRTKSKWPLSGWEPVIYAGGRRTTQRDPLVDALVKVGRPRRADPERVIGAKPADFVWWLFGLMNVRPGDQLDDLYPGSGGVGRAMAMLEQASF
jgi:hypothetical protein